MRAVTDTRTFVVVGARPRSSAIDALGDVPIGGEAVVVVLGLHPTPDQQRLTEEALTLAAERRFTLGDIAFAVATGAVDTHLDRLREAVVEVVAGAVRTAVS